MEIVRDFSSFLCSSFGVVDDANDRSIARSVALSPVVVSLRETVDEIWVEITSMIYTVCSYKMSFSKIFPFLDPAGLVSVCDRFFFSSSSYPRLSPSNGTCASRGGDSGIGGFVYVVDDATTRESETKRMVD